MIIVTSWDETNVENRKTAIWNSISSYSTGTVNISACDYGVNPEYTFDITNIVLEQVKEETMPRCGIMLKAVNENTPAVCFNTSESGESSGIAASKPYIVVSYNALPSTETEGIISDGIYQIVNKRTGKALSFSNMALSQQTSNQASNTQLFKIVYVSGGRYRIIPMSNTNYCLVAMLSNLSMQQIDTSSTAQNWRITSVDNGYRIANGSNPTYLLSTYNSSDSVYSMQKTTGSTWELRLIELPVPLYVQKDGAACGYACDTMVAHYFGCTSVTQTDMENKAKQLSADGNERYAYAICNALNYYLDINNTGVTYETSGMYLYNSSTYVSMLQNEINNGDPVIIQTKFVSSEYFKYNTMETGHYMVVIGMYFDTTENEYMCIINDSHDQYCDRRVVPASVVYSICVTHGGYVLKRAEEVS